jgi:hypothetical protein
LTASIGYRAIENSASPLFNLRPTPGGALPNNGSSLLM